MERSQRSTNPNNYNLNGTIKKGRKIWKKSKKYLKLQSEFQELNRLLSAERNRQHGEITNKLISEANTWFLEDLSYKTWTKLYGKAVGKYSPSGFIQKLIRKAENAGGSVILINPWTAKLSQYDHGTDSYTKKPLSQKIHFLMDGSTIQRDIYSAFLALNVKDGKIDRIAILKKWQGMELCLRNPLSKLPEYPPGFTRKWNSYFPRFPTTPADLQDLRKAESPRLNATPTKCLSRPNQSLRATNRNPRLWRKPSRV